MTASAGGPSRPALAAVPSRPDLPPAWDGVPVEWSEWSDARTSLAFHLPAEQLACDQCGTVDEPRVCFGSRPPARPTTTAARSKTTTSGRRYSVLEQVPSWPVRDLFAARCRHCGHDVVTDQRTGERWDLEPEDYGPAGSTPSDTLF